MTTATVKINSDQMLVQAKKAIDTHKVFLSQMSQLVDWVDTAIKRVKNIEAARRERRWYKPWVSDNMEKVREARWLLHNRLGPIQTATIHSISQAERDFVILEKVALSYLSSGEDIELKQSDWYLILHWSARDLQKDTVLSRVPEFWAANGRINQLHYEVTGKAYP